MNNFSNKAGKRGRSRSKKWFLAILLIVVVALLVSAALVQNRGLHIEAQRDGFGVKLEPAEQPAAAITTHNDGSPVVTAASANVEVHVTVPTNSVPAQPVAKEGMSTHGAGSPIVTGQGAVVKSTVDIRP